MVKNILSLDDFKSKKSIHESVTPVNEMVEAIDDNYRVGFDVDLPKALISSFIKKVKESTGKDLRAEMGEKRLAERLVQWLLENYLNIENLPVEIVTGTDKSPVQPQAQSQAQPQLQDEDGQSVQAQTQVQVQPTQNAQGEKPSVQIQNAQSAAQQVPAQEI